jgi:hypothetical protein
MTKIKLELAKAQTLTAKIIDALAPGCQRIEPAGSVRRCKPEVGDLEIVCTPRSKQVSMFGELDLSATWLDDILAGLLREGRLTPGHANGPKYKSFIVSSTGVQLDLFIVTPPEWGVCFTIRTGSAELRAGERTQRALSNGWGYMPGDEESGYYYIASNRLYAGGRPEYRLVEPEDGEAYQETTWRGGILQSTCEEIDLFETIGLDWIDPAARP